MPKKLIIFPAGGNAREALVIVEAVNKTKMTWDVVGFLDADPSLWGRRIHGVKIFSEKDCRQRFAQAHVLAVVGNPQNYLKRADIIKNLKVNPTRFATVIHPTAVISSNAKIGFNTLIMANVVVGSNVSIGNHSVILPNTTISHDSQIGDYTCIGANVAISGSVMIETGCYIGSGVNIREKIRIGKKSLIGLGSNVVKDVKKETTVTGNPAKSVKGKTKR